MTDKARLGIKLITLDIKDTDKQIGWTFIKHTTIRMIYSTHNQ